MKILIVSDFSKDDDYSFRARHEYDLLKGHCDLSIRCVQGKLSIGNLKDIDIALHVIHPASYQYIPHVYNLGWVKKGDIDKNITSCAIMDEVVGDDIYKPIIDHSKFGRASDHTISYLDDESVIFTINNDFDKSSTIKLIEQFNRIVDPSEPLAMLIKTNKPIDPEITKLKTVLGLYPDINFYKKEVVIGNSLNYNDLMNLYYNFDYFVDSTNGADQRYIDIGHSYGKVVNSIEEAYELFVNKKTIELGPVVLIESHLNFLQERV